MFNAIHHSLMPQLELSVLVSWLKSPEPLYMPLPVQRSLVVDRVLPDVLLEDSTDGSVG